MAHMIENNQLAYTGQVPWHGLGVAVPAGTTGAEMLKLAGLDWKVEKRPIAIASAGYTREEIAEMDDAKSVFSPVGVEKFAAITRSDNNYVFQIAGADSYQPVQNDEIVDFFREYCEAGNATMETVGALRGGAVVWALAKLAPGSSANIGGVDRLEGYMLMATSHDATLVTVGRPTQVRVVCNNTITAALRSKREIKNTFRLHHGAKFTDAKRDEAKQMMGMAIEQVQATNELAEKLSSVTIGQDDWLQFMAKLMGEDKLANKKGEISGTALKIQQATIYSPGSDLVTAKGTLWGALNGVTYFADHLRGSSIDSRMMGAWFGAGEQLKADAVTVAMEMAGIFI